MNQLLAIDTSTDFAGIAVSGGSNVVELRWSAGRNQTTSVLEQIDRCLKLGGIAVSDLSAIAVAIGPGMFNGLRVGAKSVRSTAEPTIVMQQCNMPAESGIPPLTA